MPVADPERPARATALAEQMRSPSRPIVLAGMALVLVAIVVLVLVVSDPFAGSEQAERRRRQRGGDIAGDGDAAAAVLADAGDGTLGYADASSIRVPAGTPPSAVAQAEAVRHRERSDAADGEVHRWRRTRQTLAGQQATLSAAREKESVDCAGEGAAETASTGSSPGGEDASDGASPGGTSAGLCTGDVEMVSSDRQGVGRAAVKVAADRASLASAEAAWRAPRKACRLRARRRRRTVRARPSRSCRRSVR